MKVEIKFRGIDNWNRPVYKVVDKAIYFGSTDTLFSQEAEEEMVNNYFKDNLDELEYFGTHFGCEPMGGRNQNLVLEIQSKKEVLTTPAKTNNKIIAEFMGLNNKIIHFDKFYSFSDAPFFYTTETSKEKVVYNIAKYTKYQTDWDWLIPVVEKIEETHCVDIFGKAVSIHEKYDGEMIVDLSAKNSSTKIEAVYCACLEFINYYNKKHQ